MNYSIADFILRTEGAHNNLVECGLNGFKPFEIEGDCDIEPTMVLRMDSPISDSTHPVTKSIHSFEFEQEYATGELARYAEGYRFSMCRNGETFILVKKDGSNIVESNLGAVTEVNPSLIRFGLWIMFGIVIAPLGAIAIHSSVAVKEHQGVLCLGESGTGKSTHTRLWRENIEGAKLLNDDSPIIRVIHGKCRVYGSPWSGKTPCYKNHSCPLAGMTRLRQAPMNRFVVQEDITAFITVLPGCSVIRKDAEQYDALCATLVELTGKVKVGTLDCLPDREAAMVCRSALIR